MLELYLNSAQCLICNDILTSRHQHDYIKCSCENMMVDGGLEYIRRGFKDYTKIKDLIEYVDTKTGEIIPDGPRVQRRLTRQRKARLKIMEAASPPWLK